MSAVQDNGGIGLALFFMIALLHHLRLLGISREPCKDESGCGQCGHCRIVPPPDPPLEP